MSYAFQMTFLEVPQNEVLSVCMEIVNYPSAKANGLVKAQGLYS